jgi:hypothetical protein
MKAQTSLSLSEETDAETQHGGAVDEPAPEIDEDPFGEFADVDIPAEGSKDEMPTQEGGEGSPPAEATATPIDDTLLEGARELGFSEDYTQRLSNAGLLEDTIGALAPVARPAQGVTEEEPAPAPLELDPDLYDDETLEKVKAHNEHLQRQHAENSTLRQERINADAAQQQQQFDKCVADLGEGWNTILGKGDVKPGTTEFKNRIKVIQEMHERRAGQVATGSRASLNIPTLFDKALKTVFSEQQSKLATSKLQSKVESRAKQVLPRTTNRKGASLSPRAAAIAAVAQIRTDRGIDADEDYNDWGE